MNHIDHDRLERQVINHLAATDPRGLVEQACAAYADRVRRLTELLLARMGKRHLIMLSGPSSAGKTTTAETICRQLGENGVETFVISVDDFYRGRGNAPRLPDGNFDYETIEALDLDLLQRCMSDLLTVGEADLPQFDFVSGKRRREARHLSVPPHAAVIIEGIHAINPLFEAHVDRRQMTKVFVDPSRVFDGESVALTRRQLRLSRRLLRDKRFRASLADNTLRMWPQVVRGELAYMMPYVDTVDFRVDTTHGFEMGMYREELMKMLENVTEGEAGKTAAALCRTADTFIPIDRSLLPPDSLICEFLGFPATDS